MPNTATEVTGSSLVVPTAEFLGSTFADRKRALQQVDEFRRLTEQALLDTVAICIGNEVNMVFRPSRTIKRDYPNSNLCCYYLFDNDQPPHEETVTIRSVDDADKWVVATRGELVDGLYDAFYGVSLRDIVSLELIEPKARIISE